MRRFSGMKGQRALALTFDGSADVVGYRRITSAGSGSLTSPGYRCMAVALLWGGGGGGGGSSLIGGQGGHAVLRRFHCGPAATIAFTVGSGGTGDPTTPTDGGATTITLPTGAAIKAPGGKSAINLTASELPTDGNLNRRGGSAGGSPGPNGGAGEYGGVGGTSNGSGGGGGGGAGFSDRSSDLTGGAGGNSGNAGVAPGGGGGNAQNGAPGQLILFFVRVMD